MRQRRCSVPRFDKVISIDVNVRKFLISTDEIFNVTVYRAKTDILALQDWIYEMVKMLNN